MKIEDKLSETFDKSQHGHQNQAKLAEGLKTFYSKLKDNDKQTFRDEFIRHLKPCLVVFTREPAVERVMEFVARFAACFAQTSDEDEIEPEVDADNFYHFLFDFLLKNHVAQGKAVRFRICQLVKLLLHVVPRDAALDEDLVERISDCMLTRMYDIIPSVRAQAVRALTRLQQPTESDCPIIQRYLFLLRCDESAEVRSAVLSCITLSTRTLPEVMKRVRDVKESVRKLAYQVMSQKVSIRALTCSRRLHLIEQGLLDHSESVKNVVKTQLLQAWLRTYEGNILEVLEKLDAIGSYKTTCKAVQALFEYSQIADLVSGFTILNENNLISFDILTPESALYWCELCQFLRSKGVDCEEHLEKLLPSLTEFCEYLELYVKKFLRVNEEENSQEAEAEAEEKEFIAEQLIKIASGFDLSDDAGRRVLNETVRRLTLSVDVTHFSMIVPALARILNCLHDSDHEADRVEMAAEMIQDAREKSDPVPSQTVVSLSEDEIRSKQIQLARIRVKMIELSEVLEEEISAKKFVEAAEVQKELDGLKVDKAEIEKSMEPQTVEIDGMEEDFPPDLKNDPATILKCLQITKEVCSSISFFDSATKPNGKVKRRLKSLHPTLLELVNTLVLPSIANPHPAIREVAVECLGNCCLYSFDLSAQHLPLFLQIIQADVVEVRIKALGGIVDVLRIYGVEAFAPNKDKKKESDPLANEEEDKESYDVEDDENNYITTLILTKIVEMLDEDHADIRHAAASGLAMILVSGRIVSPAIFSRLVLLWYNPTTQDEFNTLNKISCFLDFYPYMCKATHNCLEEAFLPTLRTLFEAPNSSPLASVNIQNVAELLVHLTKPSLIKSLHRDKDNEGNGTKWREQVDWLGDRSAHDGLAIKLSNEILRDPQSVNVVVLSRSLSMLELSSNLQDNLKDLTVLCEDMLEVVKNKQSWRYLKKFQSQVLSLILVRPSSKQQENMSCEEETMNDENTQHSEEASEDNSQGKTLVLDENDTTFHIQRKRLKNNNQPPTSAFTNA
ncbi:condensin complex subunit 3-like [Styela clava]